jgi:hypothetical protein
MGRVGALLGAVAVAGIVALAVACSGGEEKKAATLPDSGARPDDATAASLRASCTFARGALPAQTLGASAPLGPSIPIDTIVVLMLENRSFDSYFGHLGKYAGRTDIESAPDSTILPDKVGPDPGLFHPWEHAQHLCLLDTNHEWSGAHLEWDQGKMDGFVQANQGFAENFPDGGAPALKDGRTRPWLVRRTRHPLLLRPGQDLCHWRPLPLVHPGTHVAQSPVLVCCIQLRGHRQQLPRSW